jgi:hypothetical protein
MNEIKSNEEQVLLNCLRDPQSYDFSSAFDLETFKELCEYHRIRPQLYEMLKINPSLPPELKSYLLAHREQWTLRNLAFLSEAQKINASFKTADIEVIFYKGGLLSQEIYGDFAIRESCDLDIIVAPEKLLQVGELLTELGYKLSRDPELWGKELFFNSDSEIEWFNKDKNINIDLHWRPNHPRTGFNFSFCDCRKNSRYLDLQGQHFQVMQKEFTFMLLVCHRIKSTQRRFCHLLDLINLLEDPELNWNLVMAHVKKFKLEKVLAKSFTSIKAIHPEYLIPLEVSKALPNQWQNKNYATEDLKPLRKSRQKPQSWLKKSTEFILYSASNHDSLRKKISCNSFIFLHPSVEVMRAILLSPKWTFLYPFIIPFIYLKLALFKK